jgi:hypothetical protein
MMVLIQSGRENDHTRHPARTASAEGRADRKGQNRMSKDFTGLLGIIFLYVVACCVAFNPYDEAKK